MSERKPGAASGPNAVGTVEAQAEALASAPAVDPAVTSASRAGAPEGGGSDDPLWYKDAVIYQLHVRAYADANGDGIGDFTGLIERLDYIQSLGVNTIWLLPFYPSPLRDDGYDIADYRSVNPSYGSNKDFRRFTFEAHQRGLRVVTELVINHTSDQHPWFQRARHAPPGSKARDWYVWSDDDKKYSGTRIIFTDTEPSNWAWDPVAQSYYWHRFFSHQPDLNFDNPRVMEAVVSVMRFWLDAGVDGLRLDAIPYLVERDGTNNENLPETHAVLKALRRALDEKHPGRVFLAEANQWPEDVQQYFGDDDECHMAFHFPLMPRMYMAIAQEDRHSITDIMRQTPEIPERCQWGIFLRNHDELTLEMVSDTERDYLWKTYAAEQRARINVGIRRRLAPLMDNDRRKIELMNSLLMSMPGTPIVYYGDEIGMGDNIFLGDRNGVRTPMQWTPDRNGGFSRADPNRLYSPPIMDPIYGYQAVNVEAQERNPSSLLNWMKRLIAVRQGRKVFGRGTLSFLYPKNRKVLSYIRAYEDEAVLCVVNLARTAEAVELDLAAFTGRVPVELFGQSAFPAIRETPYTLTLPGHSFFWFLLASAEQLPTGMGASGSAPAATMAEYVTLVFSDGWKALDEGRTRGMFERDVLPEYMPTQRWFRAKDAGIKATSLAALVPFGERDRWALAFIDAETKRGDEPVQRYFMPLARDMRELSAVPEPLYPAVIAKIRRTAAPGVLIDAAADSDFALAFVAALRRGGPVSAGPATVRFEATALLDDSEPATPGARVLGFEQSNTSIVIEERYVLKLYRRLEVGIQPEVEIGRFLTEVAHYPNTPALLGHATVETPDGSAAIAVLQAFVRNQGDGWSQTLAYLSRYLDESAIATAPAPAEPGVERAEPHAGYLELARAFGHRTAELHRALCPAEAEPAFQPEPVAAGELATWVEAVRGDVDLTISRLRDALPSLPDDVRPMAERLAGDADAIKGRIGAGLSNDPGILKTRYHGDFHLGQVLVFGSDFMILDFEGEPNRPLEERRRKHSPMRDVAGMLRSLDYAAWAAVDRTALTYGDRRAELVASALAWRDAAAGAFLGAYRDALADYPAHPRDAEGFKALLDLFLVEKLLYEIRYELANRPAWVRIPVAGAAALLLPEQERSNAAVSG